MDPRASVLLAIPGLAVALACASSPSEAPDATGGAGGTSNGPGTGGASSGGTGAPPIVGSFTITLKGIIPSPCPGEPDTAATSGLFGKIFEAPRPAEVKWNLDSDAGGCQLLVPEIPFCASDCGTDAVCTDANQCTRYPKPQSVGKVQVEGVGPTRFDLDPVKASYTPPAGLDLPYPPFEEGAPVRLRAAGGAYGAFTLEGKAIAPLVLGQAGALALRPNQPLGLTWTPPRDPSASRIHVVVDLTHHGGTRGKIECDVPDSGALEIPAAMVTKLIALGTAGFPTLSILRRSVASTTIAPGTVVLRIESVIDRDVEIPGLISCVPSCTTGQTECPVGLTCNVRDLTCK